MGSSVVLPLPPEIVHDGGLTEDHEGEIERAAPEVDPEFTTWMDELLERYDSAWRQLADL